MYNIQFKIRHHSWTKEFFKQLTFATKNRSLEVVKFCFRIPWFFNNVWDKLKITLFSWPGNFYFKIYWFPYFHDLDEPCILRSWCKPLTKIFNTFSLYFLSSKPWFSYTIFTLSLSYIKYNDHSLIASNSFFSDLFCDTMCGKLSNHDQEVFFLFALIFGWGSYQNVQTNSFWRTARYRHRNCSRQNPLKSEGIRRQFSKETLFSTN